jgi:hypothetical protein
MLVKGITSQTLLRGSDTESPNAVRDNTDTIFASIIREYYEQRVSEIAYMVYKGEKQISEKRNEGDRGPLGIFQGVF